jgi:hypothetical protein
VLKRRTHARAHALVGWLSGRLDLSVRPCGRARGVAGVGVVYYEQRYRDAMIVNIAFTLVFNTGLFPDSCCTWQARAIAIADKT